MRTIGTLGALALVLGLTLPAMAQSPATSDAMQVQMGPGGGGPGTGGPERGGPGLRLKADGAIARIRTNEGAKAQLTPEQREKLKTLRAVRWQRRGGGEGGGDGTSEAPSALHDRS